MSECVLEEALAHGGLSRDETCLFTNVCVCMCVHACVFVCMCVCVCVYEHSVDRTIVLRVERTVTSLVNKAILADCKVPR